MDNGINNLLSDQMNEINVYIQDLINLTDIMLLGMRNEKFIDIEMAISSICIFNRLLKDAGEMSEKAINTLDKLV